MWCSLWGGESGGEDRPPAVVESQVPKAGPGAPGGGGIGWPELWNPRSQRRDLGHPAVAVSAARSCGIPGPKGGTWGTRRWRYRLPGVVVSQVPKAGLGALGLVRRRTVRDLGVAGLEFLAGEIVPCGDGV